MRSVRLLVVAVAAWLALGVASPANALIGRVCCTSSISLRTNSGVLVTSLQHGTYTISVRDRSSVHNFHLKGYLVDRKTGVAFVGRRTWTVRFYRGHTYTYVCDMHPTTMRRTFTVH